MTTPLPTRRLGTTGPTITTVGFGAWAAGGGGWAFAWGPQDDAESVAAIHHAVARGINWIDTAAVYGYGHSEEVVGRALAGMPASERPLVFTKCGLVRPALERAGPHERARPRLAPRARARGVRGLAAAAGRRDDRPLPVPLARPDRHRRPLGRRLELRRAAPRAVRGGRPRDLPPAPLLDDPPRRGRERGPLVRRPRHRRHRLQPDAVGPADRLLHRGAGRVPPGRRLAPQRPPLPGAEAQPEPRPARRPAPDRGEARRWPGVTGAIVGARSPRQVDGWLAAATLRLDEADHAAIRAAIAGTGAGSGPITPA